MMGEAGMELKYFYTFRVVAKELNFTKAAYILNYSQSSVSAHIRALEEEFNTPLFERLGKQVLLTEAGQRMLIETDRIITYLEEMKKIIPGCSIPSGTLTIGAHESQCAYRLIEILREFRSSYPQVQLIFRPIISDEQIKMLIGQGILDAAFLLSPPINPQGLVVEPLIEEPILVISHPEHPLSKLSKVMPSDLNNETILTTEQGCNYRQLFENMLASNNVRVGTKIEFASIEGIKQCVIAGLGIAVLPEITIEKEIAEDKIAVLPWNGPSFPISTQIAWHKDKWISPALKAFVDIARSKISARK
jgi:DNA-binding transcriptional LysR family regulator